MLPQKILKRYCSGLAEIAFMDIIPHQIISVFEIAFFFSGKTFGGGEKMRCLREAPPPPVDRTLEVGKKPGTWLRSKNWIGNKVSKTETQGGLP